MRKVSCGRYLTIFTAAFAMSLPATAAQGDFDGVYKVTLYRINENTLTKSCFYRGDVTLVRDDPIYFNRIYFITMNNAKTVNVSSEEVMDITSGPRRDIYVIYEKRIARFSDCPDDLLLIFNTLTGEFRES